MCPMSVFIKLSVSKIDPSGMIKLQNNTIILQGVRSIQAVEVDGAETVELAFTTKNAWAETVQRTGQYW